jgi:hypothetical protein
MRSGAAAAEELVRRHESAVRVAVRVRLAGAIPGVGRRFA